MKRIVCMLAVGVLVCALAGCGGGGGGVGNSGRFTLVKVGAAPDKGFDWPYYLVVPNASAHSTLIVEPNNTGSTNDDPVVHDLAAKQLAQREMSFAQALNCPLLVPTFPRPSTNWQVYTHALDRDTLLTTIEGLVRLDLQLVAMVEDAQTRLAARGLYLDDKFFIKGFSASGMFANRFCVLHPDRIKAAAIGSPGGWPIAPVASWEGQTLRYHVGVSDVTDLVGAPFDLATFKTVPLFLFLGDQDTNDSVPYTDGYEPQDHALVDSLFGETPVARWPKAEQIYDSVGCNCTFRLYPGVGHTVSPDMRRDIIQFFAAHL